MITIKIGGVPEHFNLPILLAIEEGKFAQQGVDLSWTYFPGGTGAMTKALAEHEVDMAILLTEGFVAAAAAGLRARIVKTYIDSPLVWGIYTGAKSNTQSIYDTTPKLFAISRFGSGSHLMALIHAEQRGAQLAQDKFVVVDSLEMAVESLSRGETQIFYWEKLMTKKYVSNGTLRLIGEFSAPWSGFLIVVSDQAWRENKAALQTVLQVINEAGNRFKERSDTVSLLQARFQLSVTDVQSWLANTFWNPNFTVRLRGLQNAFEALRKVNTQLVPADVMQWCVEEMTVV